MCRSDAINSNGIKHNIFARVFPSRSNFSSCSYYVTFFLSFSLFLGFSGVRRYSRESDSFFFCPYLAPGMFACQTEQLSAVLSFFFFDIRN